MEKSFLIRQFRKVLKHMRAFGKLQQVKEMITQLAICWTIIISKIYYNMIAIDLIKQQSLDADPKVIQQFNFTGNLDRAAGGTMFSLLKKQNKLF